jgi:hypothetical protein
VLYPSQHPNSNRRHNGPEQVLAIMVQFWNRLLQHIKRKAHDKEGLSG